MVTEDNENSSADVKIKKKKKQKTKEDDNVTEQDHNSSAGTSNENAATEVKTDKKKKKRNKNKVNGDAHSDTNSHKDEIVKKNLDKTKNHQPDGFVVEVVSKQTPSQESNVSINKSKANINETSPGKAQKRKLESHADSNQMNKKKKQDFSSKGKKDFKTKFNQKDKFKNKNKFKKKQDNDTANDNPLSKLSDERLKAYGLNPKKYKNFLKYKKF